MEKKIQTIIKKEFGISPTKIIKIAEGYSHSNYFAKFDKDPFEVIIRFSNNVDKAVNLSKEKSVIELLSNKNIPVPKIYAFHWPDNKSEGYMILEKIQGQTLDLIWDRLNLNEKKKMTKEIGNLVSKLHNIKFEEFGSILEGGQIQDFDNIYEFKKSGEKLEHYDFLKTFFMDISNEVATFLSYKGVSLEFFERFMHFLINNIDEIRYSDKPVFIHGDFSPSHIFVDRKNLKIIGLIDFEHSAAYPPEYDFIKLHRSGFFSNLDIKNELINSYGAINEKALEIYCITRDFQFGVLLLESGENKKANEVLINVGKKINFKGDIFAKK